MAPNILHGLITMSVEDKELLSKQSINPDVEYNKENEKRKYPARLLGKHEETEFKGDDRKDSAFAGTVNGSQAGSEASPFYTPDGEHEVDPLLLEGQGQRASISEPRDVFHPPPAYQHGPCSIHELDRALPAGPRPANFGIVVPGVYRSSFPQPEDYPFIESLKLKTIVTLVGKDPPPGYDAFLEKNNIVHWVFDMKGTKKEDIPIKTMESILRLVVDRRNHPLLIHCNHGKHRTGCVVAVLRKLSGWDLNNIISEYKSYADPKARDCDIRYITGFEPASISNPFRESGWPFRTRSFFWAALLAFLRLIAWFFSSTRLSSTPQRKWLR
ncbi:hypothetical protein VTK56DRAFT_8351 [Thermocarpiscus australiensis]